MEKKPFSRIRMRMKIHSILFCVVEPHLLFVKTLARERTLKWEKGTYFVKPSDD
jgi:hypothetical protein